MGPAEAIGNSSRKMFDYRGRASRAEFWWTWGMLYVAAMMILLYRGLPGTEIEIRIAATVILFAIALPMMAVGTRRLVDAGVWRWFFVLTFVFGIVAQFIYRIPVPSAESLANLNIQFDDRIVPASDVGYFPFLRALRDIMPWIGRPLAILCLLLALLPSRETVPNTDIPKVTQ